MGTDRKRVALPDTREGRRTARDESSFAAVLKFRGTEDQRIRSGILEMGGRVIYQDGNFEDRVSFDPTRVNLGDKVVVYTPVINNDK